MPHTYDELRAAVLDILAGRERVQILPTQYEHLLLGLGEVFARREGRLQPRQFGADYALDAHDREALLGLFWDLHRQNIIALGQDENRRRFPFFRLTEAGRQMATGKEACASINHPVYENAVPAAGRIPNARP